DRQLVGLVSTPADVELGRRPAWCVADALEGADRLQELGDRSLGRLRELLVALGLLEQAAIAVDRRERVAGLLVGEAGVVQRFGGRLQLVAAQEGLGGADEVA